MQIRRGLLEMLRVSIEAVDWKRLSRQNYPFDDIEIQKDIPYLNSGEQGHLLDIYSPKGTKGKLPTIINLHGGGLAYGYKELNRNFNFELVRRGFAVISLNYRLIPQVTFLDQIQDIGDAFLFIQMNMEQYPCNLEKLAVVGDSAGALLGLMCVAINNNEGLQKEFGVRGAGLRFCAFGSISIMLNTKRAKGIISLISPFIETKEQRQLEAFKYLDRPSKVLDEAAFPPCFLITSAEDFLQKDTHALRTALDLRHIPYEIMDWPKENGHMLPHVFCVTYPQYKESIQTIDRLSSFIHCQTNVVD